MRMRTIGALLWCQVLLWPAALLRAQDAPAPQALPEPAAAAVRAYQQEHKIPGLSVAIAQGNAAQAKAAQGSAVVFAQGFGLADLENDVAASADTVYRLGSISKPVTAVAAMQLVERGKLQLDVDVRTYVPEFPAKPWPISLRQLLGHLGGVRHYQRGESESTEHFDTQRAGLARFAGDPLLHEPGTKYFYSTYGFNLVAAAVEAADGRPFAAAVKDIAARAGAPSLQDDDVRRLIKHRAQGYIVRGEALENSALMDGSYKLGGGGLCSSAPDLARFGLALLDGRLLGEEALRTMTTEQKTTAGEGVGYGCGLRVGERHGRREYQHGGAQSRVSTVLVLWPEPRAAAVVMCNLEGVRPLPLAQQLLDLLVAPAPR